MATGERRTADGDATARWLGESGELVSRYQAAVGEHVGRMATVNADLRRELAGARATVARLRALLRRCEPYLGNYQCEGQKEGDELGALEADIAAELPEREGAGE